MANLQYTIYSLSSVLLTTSYYFQQKYIFLLTICSSVFVIVLNGLTSIYIDTDFIQFTKIISYLILLNLTWNLALSLINIYYQKDQLLKNKLPDDCIKDIYELTKNLDPRTQRLLIRTINKHLVSSESDNKKEHKNL